MRYAGTSQMKLVSVHAQRQYFILYVTLQIIIVITVLSIHKILTMYFGSAYTVGSAFTRKVNP